MKYKKIKRIEADTIIVDGQATVKTIEALTCSIQNLWIGSLYIAGPRTVLAGTNGETGEIAWDSNFIYICIDGNNNIWRKASLINL